MLEMSSVLAQALIQTLRALLQARPGELRRHAFHLVVHSEVRARLLVSKEALLRVLVQKYRLTEHQVALFHCSSVNCSSEIHSDMRAIRLSCSGRFLLLYERLRRPVRSSR